MKHFARQRPSTLVATLVMCVVAACGGKSATHNNGPDTGGSSGDGDGTGASTGDGDGDLSGGSGGHGGSTGGGTSTGGTLPTGGTNGQVLVTLGDDCSSPGSFACAESNPKLALICDGDGRWELRETCGGDALCDFNAGSNEGTCRVPLAECDGQTGKFCGGKDVVTCKEGGFDTALVEECAEGCENAECVWVADPCLEIGESCADDECMNPSDGCWSGGMCENRHWVGGFGISSITGVRLPVTELCHVDACERDIYLVAIAYDQPESFVRFTVGPGWGMIPFDDDGLQKRCDNTVEHCLILPPAQGDPEQGEYRGAILVPLSENTVTRNLKVEVVEPGTTCD